MLIVPVALAAVALVAAGCGGSDKPAYCSNVSDLQSSVDTLKSVELQSGVLSTLQTDLEAVRTNTDAVVSSAKADFPNETSALQSSVSRLATTIQKLPSSPTPQQLAPLVPKIDSTVTAAQDFQSATSSACD